MSRFDKTELEGVIENMEKLLREETTASDPEPVAEPSVVQTSDGAAGVPPSVTKPVHPSLHDMLFADASPYTGCLPDGCGEAVWRVHYY
jgi:hypothetical protein